ncbi:hypothetical protein [Chryseobacterium camelliae]|uniref:Uncharacterized protein n=1 Tax=Chryseobacterium camelliae TaxID=1265445 RepID=A0ABU0TP07_9FLAO|nr:hypothetical protein [Chryseobacterium camelliae]MDQ1098762.1 hypothetical protein [Chryseobacterium camelliae]
MHTLPATLLWFPLVGNVISSEVYWSGYDFLMAAVILWSAVGFIDLISGKVAKPALRIPLCFLAFFALAAVWAELAVGIFGSLLAGN